MLTYPLEGGGVTMGFQKKQPIALANIKYNTNSNHVLSTFFRRALPLFCLLDLIKKNTYVLDEDLCSIEVIPAGYNH